MFQNADVTMPILSTGNLADEENDIMYSKRGGKNIDLTNVDNKHVIRKRGVYFLKLKSLTNTSLMPKAMPALACRVSMGRAEFDSGC